MVICDFKVGQQVRVDGHAYLVKNMMAGGMAQVLLCQAVHESYPLLYRPLLACKVFSPEQDPEQIKNELKIWKGLSHPGVVTLTAIGHVNDWLCACMPWFVGGSVSRGLLSEHGGLKTLQRMLLQVTDALEYASDQGVLHLDIKPANILYRGDFAVADWGIARIVSAGAIKGDASFGGTLPYMGAERFLGHEPTIASDLYSVGVSTLELITDQLPSHETSVEGYVRAVCTGKVAERIASMTVRMPRGWQDFINRTSAFHPQERPRSYGDVRRLISKLEC